MSSPSDSLESPTRNQGSPLTVVVIGVDEDPVLPGLLTAAGARPRVVRLMGTSSEGRQLLELTANPGPVVYAPWPEKGSPQ